LLNVYQVFSCAELVDWGVFFFSSRHHPKMPTISGRDITLKNYLIQ